MKRKAPDSSPAQSPKKTAMSTDSPSPASPRPPCSMAADSSSASCSKAATPGSSSVAQQVPSGFLNMICKYLKDLKNIQTMLKTKRTILSRILYPDWDPEVQELPEDEDLDALLRQTELALDKAVRSFRVVRPNEIPVESMKLELRTMKTNMKTLIEHGEATEQYLDTLTNALAGTDAVTARNEIQRLLEKGE